MKVEAFTVAKDPNDPARNEDRCVVIPGRAYAVIDGVSDKTGFKLNGFTGGQLAGRLIEEEIREVCASQAPETIEAGDLCRRLEKRFQTALAAAEKSDVPANIRLGAQLVLVLEGRTRFRFVVVGDSGIRINGSEVFSGHHEIDDICAAIRCTVWQHLDRFEVPRSTRNAVARAYTVQGLGRVLPEWTRWISENDLGTLRSLAFQLAEPKVQHLDATLVGQTLIGGLREQSRYVNRVHPLGFPSLNGFPIPPGFLVQFDRDKDMIDTIELFSDGYFGCAERPEIDSWEERIRRIEAEDPDKVGVCPSTKGSGDGRFTDARTILILRRPWS
jgi:hypothetical protein